MSDFIVLNSVEIRNLAKFAEEHEKCSTRHPTRMVIATVPTGIGTVIDVKCLECSDSQNITDYECW